MASVGLWRIQRGSELAVIPGGNTSARELAVHGNRGNTSARELAVATRRIGVGRGN